MVFCSEWELEDGVVPIVEIRILLVMNLDGTQTYDIKCSTDCPLSTSIGLLELSKLALVQQHNEENG